MPLFANCNSVFQKFDMTKTKVLLADLRHIKNGILFADNMPLGIGYMKAVIDKEMSDAVDCEIFAYPEDFKNAVINSSPDVVMVTNYMWNEALSLWYLNYAKQQNSNILTVMGGPNISIEEHRQKQFVESHPQIDIYVLGEGDFVAKDIVELFIKHQKSIDALKNSGELKSCVYRNETETVVENNSPRVRKLDEIPSPWLTGVMDKFFDNKLSPLYETNRGCPFTCTFCVQGTKFYNKVTLFGVERVREELHYIGQKIQSHSPNVRVLRMADPNFGMYERDVEIAKYMGETQKLYHYPMFIDATTGKNKPERVIQAMEQVSGALIMWQSVQSLDDTVLTNVKRENIKLSAYQEINVYLKGRGLRSQADLILCLPGETLASHVKALETLTNAGVLRFNNFQAMILKGSEMETETVRNQFKFQTKHRLIQKNFSIHNDEKVFESEEIIISTDSFSFDEYIVARKYHLLINLFLNELRFERLLNFFDVLNIPRWEWVHQMYNAINTSDFAKEVFKHFETDNQKEFFNSVEELEHFYNLPENYAKLEKAEIGDNTIHKYRVISNYYNWREICDYAYSAACDVIKTYRADVATKKDFTLFWDNLCKYQFHSSAHGRNRDEILSDSSVMLEYDIKRWFDEKMNVDFQHYKTNEKQMYHFVLPETHKSNLVACLDRWNDYSFFGMVLMIRKLKENWLGKECNLKLETTLVNVE
jgi:radical SAM superfamily enzyme YgiQ (UPF0313 family)